jgi:hypothetical protein
MLQELGLETDDKTALTGKTFDFFVFLPTSPKIAFYLLWWIP